MTRIKRGQTIQIKIFFRVVNADRLNYFINKLECGY